MQMLEMYNTHSTVCQSHTTELQKKRIIEYERFQGNMATNTWVFFPAVSGISFLFGVRLDSICTFTVRGAVNFLKTILLPFNPSVSEALAGKPKGCFGLSDQAILSWVDPQAGFDGRSK